MEFNGEAHRLPGRAKPSDCGATQANRGPASTTWQAQVLSSPPCANFAELTCLQTYKDSLDVFWKCHSNQEVKELAKSQALERKQRCEEGPCQQRRPCGSATKAAEPLPAEAGGVRQCFGAGKLTTV